MRKSENKDETNILLKLNLLKYRMLNTFITTII